MIIKLFKKLNLSLITVSTLLALALFYWGVFFFQETIPAPLVLILSFLVVGFYSHFAGKILDIFKFPQSIKTFLIGFKSYLAVYFVLIFFKLTSDSLTLKQEFQYGLIMAVLTFSVAYMIKKYYRVN